jgi:hypothetical protein
LQTLAQKIGPNGLAGRCEIQYRRGKALRVAFASGPKTEEGKSGSDALERSGGVLVKIQT